MKSLTARRMFVLSGALLLGIETETASAQNRNNIGSFQQGGFGADAQGGLGQGRFGILGQSGIGQRQQGASGFGQSGNQGRPGANIERGQDYFVGSDAQQIRRQRNSQNLGQRQRAMIDYSVENLNDMRGSSRESSSGSNNSPVRVQIRPLFTVPQPSVGEMTTRVRQQLRRALPTSISGTHISVNNGIVMIEGTVKSDYDKLLAAKMLSLQPGISQIDNRLTLESDQAAPLLFPAR